MEEPHRARILLSFGVSRFGVGVEEMRVWRTGGGGGRVVGRWEGEEEKKDGGYFGLVKKWAKN